MEILPFRYPWEEFVRNRAEIHQRIAAKTPHETSREICDAYFAETGDPLGAEKSLRFYLIMAWLDQHIHEFDEVPFAVVGKKVAGIRQPVYRAVHYFFATANEEEVHNPPTAAVIKEVTRPIIEKLLREEKKLGGE